MPTSSTAFPAALDTTSTTLPDPGSANYLNDVSAQLVHHIQHSVANSAIRALELRVGINSSTDPASHDYQIRNGGAQRTTVAATTSSLAAGATDSSQTLSVGLMVNAIKINTTAAAWVRIYSDTTSQSNDSARAQTTDPTSGTGVLLEVITTGSQTIVLSPPTQLFNSASGVTTIPITVTNNSGGTTAITVTVTIVPTEGAPGEL